MAFPDMYMKNFDRIPMITLSLACPFQVPHFSLLVCSLSFHVLAQLFQVLLFRGLIGYIG